MIKVWCEYDMGFSGVFGTFGNYYTIYRNEEEMELELLTVDWTQVGYESCAEAEDDGILSITNSSENYYA